MRNLKAKSRFVVVIIKNVCRQTLKTSKMPKTKATLIIPDNAGVCVYLSCTPLPPPICRAHATDCSLSLVNSSEKLHSEPRNNTELVWKIKKKTERKILRKQQVASEVVPLAETGQTLLGWFAVVTLAWPCSLWLIQRGIIWTGQIHICRRLSSPLRESSADL